MPTSILHSLSRRWIPPQSKSERRSSVRPLRTICGACGLFSSSTTCRPVPHSSAGTKGAIHRLTDRYSLFFTALTILVAGGAWFLSGESISALAVLVVATPCPLILATPIAIMSGIDRAAHYGLIVKSGATIEQLGEVDIAVFDKTGTLTLGTPKGVGIELSEPVEETGRRAA